LLIKKRNTFYLKKKLKFKYDYCFFFK